MEVQVMVKEFKKRERMFFCKNFEAYISIKTCKARKLKGFRRFSDPMCSSANVTDISLKRLEACRNCPIDVGEVPENIREESFTRFTPEELEEIQRKKKIMRKQERSRLKDPTKKVEQKLFVSRSFAHGVSHGA